MKMKYISAAFLVLMLANCNLRLVAVDRPSVPLPAPTTQPVMANSIPNQEWYVDQQLWTYVGGAVAAVGLTVGYLIKRKK